jgi:hypothetical protein
MKTFWNRKIVKNAFSPEEILLFQKDDDLQSSIESYFTFIKENRKIIDHDIHCCITFIKNPHSSFVSYKERYIALREEKKNSLAHSEILFGSTKQFYKRQKVARRTFSTTTLEKVQNYAKQAGIDCEDRILRIVDIIDTYLENHQIHDNWPLLRDISIFSDSLDRFKKLKSLNNTFCEEYYQLRYNNTDIYHSRVRKAKNNLPNTKEYWINLGFSEQESYEKIRFHQTKVSANRTYEDGSTRSTQFWIRRGKSESEAEKIVTQIQSRDLKFFQVKYGDIKGTSRFSEMIQRRNDTMAAKSPEEIEAINRSKGLKYEEMVAKHGLEKARRIIKQRLLHNTGSNSSRSADNFFMELDKELGIKDSISNYRGKEYFVLDDEGIMFLDYIYKGKCIEYNGSFWHADPTIYTPESIHPVHKVACREIQEKDECRIQRIKNKGIEVYIVWSNNLLTEDGKNSIINDIRQFLKD